ncbi:1-aminocyclopropane-1-carboxylate synthase [Aureococcus anophagefferens]|nr:1-aminocyclopropane-1-carboxylate synthase [Aureococcus anophagefferens]
MRNTRRAVALATFAQCARAMSSSALSGRGMKAAGYVGTASKSMSLRDEGRDLITLAVAQNALMDDLLLPKVAQAAVRASARVRYAPSWLGLPELRAGVARLYSFARARDNLVTAGEVAITSSATSAIDALLFAVLEKGDAVLTVAPFYGLYQGVEARCVLLIVDEVFALSTFEPGAFTSVLDVLDAAEDNAHVHVVYSASKDLALSGYRVGALITKNPAVLDSFKCLSIFCNAATLPQAVVAELLDDDAWLATRGSRARSRSRRPGATRRSTATPALRRLGSDPRRAALPAGPPRRRRGPALNAALEKAGVVSRRARSWARPGIFRLCHAAEPDARVAGRRPHRGRRQRRAAPPGAPAGNTPTCKAPAPGCAQS